ncbi:MAG: hypothetical protein LBM09_02640 [Candidatus Nomurabacteria bacterium]|jgi:hypothetical protein|nr:hypothetical protein [Candidatus Nomurabacteria bacterium]
MYPQGQNGQNFNVAPTGNAHQVSVTPNLGNVAANMGSNTANYSLNMPNIAPVTPEVAPLQSQERLSNHEGQYGPGQSQTPQDDQAVIQQQATVAPTPVVAQSMQSATTTTPANAADEDLIEKEWVNQAKTIVSQTKHDPYEQSKMVAALMRDYISKRYGKVVGKAQE